MSRIAGIVNPNAILNGTIQATEGDCFLSECEGGGSFVAFKFTPKRDASIPYENFKTLAVGARDKCEAALPNPDPIWT